MPVTHVGPVGGVQRPSGRQPLAQQHRGGRQRRFVRAPSDVALHVPASSSASASCPRLPPPESIAGAAVPAVVRAGRRLRPLRRSGVHHLPQEHAHPSRPAPASTCVVRKEQRRPGRQEAQPQFHLQRQRQTSGWILELQSLIRQPRELVFHFIPSALTHQKKNKFPVCVFFSSPSAAGIFDPARVLFHCKTQFFSPLLSIPEGAKLLISFHVEFLVFFF